MKIRNLALLLLTSACIQSAPALTIDQININTIAGYGDTHTPVEYPGYDRFSLLGAAYSYVLSNGETRTSGAGWIPYTNGHLNSVTITGETISYGFDQVFNWAKGSGTIFYSVGQVSCSNCSESGAGLWTEGQFSPVSPVVLRAELGTKIATLSGTARIVMNNPNNYWGLPENFLSFSTPEASIVSYSAVYTLTGESVWEASTFNRSFDYNVAGSIQLLPVPEPSTYLIFTFGLILLAALKSWTTTSSGYSGAR